MSEQFIYLTPVRTEPDVLAPAAPPPAPLTQEHIAAVDAAFTSHTDPDLAAGLLTLWLNMPIMLELTREHFPGREDITEREQRDDPEE
jgi:hypothetical protein